jgi:hypothetical protein
MQTTSIAIEVLFRVKNGLKQRLGLMSAFVRRTRQQFLYSIANRIRERVEILVNC